MLFITAGMGGGTGTGAAPVIAEIAKSIELDDEMVKHILVVAIVTEPFFFEGRKRLEQAKAGIEELKKYVDAILVINNDKLRKYGNVPLKQAFSQADDVLLTAAKGIAEIITVPGHVNVDFADVKTVLKDSGIALMGTGMADGEDRAIKAVKKALSSPLLSNNSIIGAKNILINVFSSEDSAFKLGELAEINNYIQEAAGCKADLIWGQSTDDTLGGSLNVTLIASGFNSSEIINPYDNDGKLIIVREDAVNEEEQTKEEKVAEDDKKDEDKPTADTEDANDTNDNGTHGAGEDVEFKIEDDADDDNDINDEAKDPEEEVRIVSKEFRPIDYSNVDIDEYEKTPAYVRKSIQLNIGKYKDAKYKKIPLLDE
jgi:cell division protein FtsZ